MNTDPTARGPLCLDCNYPLRGLSEHRCPECGRTFDPADEDTMNMGRPLRGWTRWVMAPIGWPTFVVVAVYSGWVLWRAMYPGEYYLFAQYLLLLPMWVGFGLILAAKQMVKDQHPWHANGSTTGRNRRHFMCILLFLVSALIVLKIPLRVGFLLARPGLEELVQEIESKGTGGLTTSARVGPYSVSYVVIDGAEGKTVFFYVRRIGEGGFIYSPHKNPAGLYNVGEQGRLWGPWYWFSED